MTLSNEKVRTVGSPLRLIGLLVIILLIIITLIFVATRPGKSAFDADPKASYAHGTFYWEDGITQPDTEYLLDVQNHYILKYQNRLGRNGADEAGRIENAVDGMVSDDVLANGLYLDWLIQRAGDERTSTDSITVNAIRWYYITSVQNDPIPSEDNEYWTIGITRDIAENLELAGLNIFEEVSSANSDYVDACISARVPVPDKLFDDTDEQWFNFGSFGNTTTDTISGGSFDENQLWMYLSDDPGGFCLALRRIRNLDPDPPKGHFDLICLGEDSNNVCFFESWGLLNETILDGAVNITSIAAGEDASVAAPCTRCHIGENPFIVHPTNTAFDNALGEKSDSLGNATWSSTDYYHAFGVPNWPVNPPPLDLSKIDSDRRCSGCHVKSSAGRFPDAAKMPNPPVYDPYCDVVLEGVLGLDSFSATMPLGDISNSADYEAHKDYLLAMCDGPDEGELVDNDFDDDQSVVSPPKIVGSLYQCAQAVYVTDFIDEAEVELRINDDVIGTIVPALGPGAVEFTNFDRLEEGDIVQTRQRVDGTWSELSKPFIVSDYKDDYPNGLPAPTIDPSTIYACSSVMAVRYDIPGFEVEVKVNGGSPVTKLTFAGHKAITPGKAPFEFEDEFTAQVRACEDVSPISDAVLAERPSNDTLTHAEINPVPLYRGQEFINIGNLTFGSNSEVLESGAGSLGGFSTPLSWINKRVSSPLTLSDQLVVSQELCGFSSQPSFSQAPTVLNCSAMPAPTISASPGDDFITVIEGLLGARVRIYDESGNELGDGTGSVITLNRALIESEHVAAVQQLGDCISSQAFQIEV